MRGDRLRSLNTGPTSVGTHDLGKLLPGLARGAPLVPNPHPTKSSLVRGQGPVSRLCLELFPPLSMNHFPLGFHWAEPLGFLGFHCTRIILPQRKKEAAGLCLPVAQPSETPQGSLRGGLLGEWQCPRKCLSVGGIVPTSDPTRASEYPAFL